MVNHHGRGEIQNWFLMSEGRHPIWNYVISEMVTRIERYSEVRKQFHNTTNTGSSRSTTMYYHHFYTTTTTITTTTTTTITTTTTTTTNTTGLRPAMVVARWRF